MEKKIIGYKDDGTIAYEQNGIGSMCLLYCKGCNKLLAKLGGRDDIYCPDCAKARGIIKMTNNYSQKG